MNEHVILTKYEISTLVIQQNMTILDQFKI